jgi:type III secretion protein T
MDQDYLSIFVNSALFYQNPIAPLSLLLLFLARMLPIISLSPFLGAKILPHPVKVTFALSLFVIFLPELLRTTTTTLDFNLMLVIYLIKELFVGFAIGFVMSVPFTIVQNAGIIIDHQRGGASLMVNDPTVQNQSSPLGTLFNFVLIYIFFTIDGPFLFIEAILSSYEVVPADKFFNTYFFIKGSGFWDIQFTLFNKIMVISMRLATPALLAILMTDVFLGIANRLAPQVQITFLGMPLKSLLALTVVCLGWKLFQEEITKQSYEWLRITKNMITMFHPNN